MAWKSRIHWAARMAAKISRRVPQIAGMAGTSQSDLPVDSTSPGRFGALLFGSSTGWSRPPRSDGAGTSQGQGEQRIPGPTIVPNSRARRRLRRSKLPGETGSPAMTSGARRSQSTVMPRYN